MHRLFLRNATDTEQRYREQLLLRRERLQRTLKNRGHLQQSLLDDDPVMLVFLALTGAIFSVELTAGLLTFGGWVSWAHLIIVGTLQIGIIYLLISEGRAALCRRKLRQLDKLLTVTVKPDAGRTQQFLNPHQTF